MIGLRQSKVQKTQGVKDKTSKSPTRRNIKEPIVTKELINQKRRIRMET